MSFLTFLRIWHDFYLALGFASAALLGFVLLGLFQRGNPVSGTRGAQSLEGLTLGSLLGVMLLSLVTLVPEQGQRSLGIIFLIASLLDAVFVGRFLWREARGQLANASPSFLTWRVALPAAVVIAAFCGSLMILAGKRAASLDGLYFFSSALLALLLIAVRNSWELLARPGQEGLKLHRRS